MPPVSLTDVRSLRVAGKPVALEVVDKVSDCEDTLGEYSVHAQRIQILAGQPHETEQDTLLHEVLHACEEAAGLKTNERWVRGVATQLLAVIKDNPRFAEYLLG